MTSLFQEMLLAESQKSAMREVKHSIAVINKIYNEWKKTGRRKNAVDLVKTSANKIATIDPSIVDELHGPAKEKLCVIIMRCLDISPWKPVDSKEKVYKKLIGLVKKLETSNPNTGTGGTLREIIMTRLSAAVYHQDTAEKKAFVAYEPALPKRYLQHLFGTELPSKTYRMKALSLPEDYETLIDTLKINHDKAKSKLDNAVPVET